MSQEFKDQLIIGTPSDEDETALRKLSKQIKEKKITIKLFLKHPLHAKLYLLYRDDKISPIIGYLGSSNLTMAGLLKQGELNVDVIEQDAAEKLVKWFEDRWNDRWCIDISEDLINIIDNSWAADKIVSPYHVYLKMIYHFCREARYGLNEFKLPKVFVTELLDFQQKAVLIAAHHLHKRNGVIIGDVVGLGKTIIATALAKIFEEDFFLETLIICPKNLIRMWEDYVHNYQLRAKVLSLSQVQSVLPKERRYRLIIIDESHNLRNREGKRYRSIQEYIELNESKIILLSATPYNKDYLDLSNQLRLFIGEDKDLGVSPERFIESIGGKVEFMAKYQTSMRSIAAFEKSSYADDWRELMRLYMVRRTRSFVKNNYANTDNGRKYLLFADGRRSYFPDRLPKKVEYPFKPNDYKDQYAKLYSDKVVDIINELELPRYGLGNYIDKNAIMKPTDKEQNILDNLSRAGKRMMGFCRTNLFKRLESSGYSFLLSMSRHALRNYVFAYAIENNLPLPIGWHEVDIPDEVSDDIDAELELDNKIGTFIIHLDEENYFNQAKKLYELFSSKYTKRLNWIQNGYFIKELKQLLLDDSKKILQVLHIAQDWNPDEDRKLNALYNLCMGKHKDDKILIFTQFADTAYYLTNELQKRNVEHFECVTGSSEDPTALAYRFSPESNKKEIKKSEELRILITTDVLSEGQNLQDSHIIVNYDLPWAIIRLIQRAGRVDRIGQKADKILCYSFLPEDGLNKIIKLRERLSKRIKQNAEVVGSDEIFFDGDPINIKDLYNEKSGLMDKDDDTEVDLASYAYQIWKNATDKDPNLKEIIPELPNVIYATKKIDSEYKNTQVVKNGVIVYTRTHDDNDILAWINNNGEIVTQSQFTILKASECSPDTEPLHKIDNHHELVEKAISHIKDVERSIGGQLGKKSSSRYKAYMRLNRFYEQYKNTLFVSDRLKKAIDDIYKHPLKEFARETLNRQLKAGISDEDLAELVKSLKEEDNLSLIKDETDNYREPQIICSMGMKNP
ncbi:helicase domain-containing protein [Candidatus Magnetoovum chiemensis]|nr:helicase domain-containing protein [Candidatus Magnetoovum chiemensis]